jgi:predicted porin
VPKVDNTGAGSTDSTTAGFAGVNRASVTDFGLAYNAGPLNLAVAQQNHKIGSTAVNSLVNPGLSSNAANGDYKLTTMAANYTIGATTVYGAYWTEKQATVLNTAVPMDAVGMMIGAKHVVGALSFSGSYATRDDKSTTNVGTGTSTAYANADRKILGLGVDYALSKRTAVWARYQNIDPNTNRSGLNPTNANASNDATKTTAIGVRHSF